MTQKIVLKFQVFLVSSIKVFKYTRRKNIVLKFSEFSKFFLNFFQKNSKFIFSEKIKNLTALVRILNSHI